MDQSNIAATYSTKKCNKQNRGSYSESRIISDPFGGNATRYEQTYKECLTAITAFLTK